MDEVAYIPIAGLVVGITCLVVGFVIQQQRVLLYGFVVSATFMASHFVQSAAVDLLGHGITLPIAGLLALMLGLDVIRRRLPVPSDLAGVPGLLLLCGLMACLVSGVMAVDPMAVVKACLLLCLSIAGSWYCVGSLAAGACSPRAVTQWIVDAVGAVSIGIACVIMVVLGPTSTVAGDGGVNNQVVLLGLPLLRLGVHGFNATGVTATSAVGLLYLIASIDRWKGLRATVIVALSAGVCAVALLWSGSRGGLAAFIAVLVAVRVLQWMSGAGRRPSVLVDGALVLGLAVVCLHLLDNFWRDPATDPVTTSALQVFLESRLPDEARDKLQHPGLFGWGYNALGGSAQSDDPNLESYWLKALVELGVVGAVVYTLMFLTLTWYVVRADFLSARRGDVAAFAPSAVVLFVWANSLSSWGFIHPFGDTVIGLAVMSSAYIGLRKSQSLGRGEALDTVA